MDYPLDTNKMQILTLEQFKDIHYGKRGIKKREKLEAGYKIFKKSVYLPSKK